ncbi:MAG: sigma-54-dependent transcriptional regulator [Gemmatimonadales bacterium]
MSTRTQGTLLPPHQQLHRLVRDLAETPYPILILGHTGSGKSTLARYIHSVSPRAAYPFVECAVTSIPDELRHVELLGSAKGAYTGAYRDRAGFVEQAHTGTLFLDELGHASLSFQQTLLGILETGLVRRIGSSRQRRVDVRFICATSVNLTARSQDGLFLRELLYRVDCLTIALPSLRERPQEIIPLAIQYLQEAFVELGRDFIPVLSEDASTVLRNAPWPGNMRQLRSVCQYIASRLRTPRPIQPADIPEPIRGLTKGHQMKHQEAQALLDSTHGNKSEAARLMGISRPSLYKLLAEARSAARKD